MAQIKIELSTPPVDGMDVKFKAPCDCTQVDGILISYPEGEQSFTFRDCHGNNMAGIGNLFGSGAYVKVILDTNKGYAYLQNADNNGYLNECLLSNSINTYTQNANNLAGSGVNGKFKATTSGTISSIKVNGVACSVRCGEESSIDLIAGNWYTFILDGNTVNFNSGGAGGGGLNFKVVYGDSAPASPKENTIWICTSFMTDWYFQPEQPENMQPGEVWISTGTAGAVAFNALKQNSILVCPISAKQMLGDDIMEDVAAKTWRNGEWVDWWNGELFENGNQFESVTGGWVQNAGLCAWDRPNTGTVSVGNILSTRSISASTINSGMLSTQNAIDLSGYSYLTVVVDTIEGRPYVMVHSFASGDVKNCELIQFIDRTGDWAIDISGLTSSGAYYVTVGGNSNGGIDVSQVKLQR